MKCTILRYLIVSNIAILTLSACGQSSIVKRWQAAGRLKNGHVVPQENEIREYEFLKDGTFNAYENGAIAGSGTYVLAGDKKSVLLKDGNQSGSLKIQKLTASELIMIFEGGRDTIAFYPSGSAQAVKAIKSAEAYDQAKKAWFELSTNYEKRKNLIENMTMIAKHYRDVDMDTNNEIFARLEATRKEINAIPVNKLPSKEEFERYDSLQAAYSNVFADFLEFLKNYPAIMETHAYKDFTAMMPGTEARIEKSKTAFVAAFKAYNQ